MDRKHTKFNRVCSCHFKDGIKENGPTIYDNNVDKKLEFHFPEKILKKKVGT